MARVKAGADIGTREARRRLKARREPYFFGIDRGLSLGYRKSGEGGAWVVRRYDPAKQRHFESRVGTADDNRDADGAEVLNFGQAQRKVLFDAKASAERRQAVHSHRCRDGLSKVPALAPQKCRRRQDQA